MEEPSGMFRPQAGLFRGHVAPPVPCQSPSGTGATSPQKLALLRNLALFLPLNVLRLPLKKNMKNYF